MYELFVGPPQLDAEWDDRGIDGVRRFLTKVWNLLLDSTKGEPVKATNEMIRARHQLIYTITSRLNDFSLNTVISGFMETSSAYASYIQDVIQPGERCAAAAARRPKHHHRQHRSYSCQCFDHPNENACNE